MLFEDLMKNSSETYGNIFEIHKLGTLLHLLQAEMIRNTFENEVSYSCKILLKSQEKLGFQKSSRMIPETFQMKSGHFRGNFAETDSVKI